MVGYGWEVSNDIADACSSHKIPMDVHRAVLDDYRFDSRFRVWRGAARRRCRGTARAGSPFGKRRGAARTPTTSPTPFIIATPEPGWEIEPGQVIPLIPVTITYEYPETDATGRAPRYQGPSIPGQRKLNLLDGSQVPLPDNAHIVNTIRLGTCSPGPCPPLPGYVLEMDGVTVEVDGDGKVYPIDPQTNMDDWRFLTERASP